MAVAWGRIVADPEGADKRMRAAAVPRGTLYMCDMAAYNILNTAAEDPGHGLCNWVRSKKAEGSLFCITNYGLVSGWKDWISTLPQCAGAFVANFLRALGLPEDDASLFDSMLAFLHACCFTITPSPQPEYGEIVFTTGNPAFFKAMHDDAQWKVVCNLVEYMFCCSPSPNNGPYRFWPVFRAKPCEREPQEECCMPGYVRLPPDAVAKNGSPFGRAKLERTKRTIPSYDHLRRVCAAGGLPFELDDRGILLQPPLVVLKMSGLEPSVPGGSAEPHLQELWSKRVSEKSTGKVFKTKG